MTDPPRPATGTFTTELAGWVTDFQRQLAGVHVLLATAERTVGEAVDLAEMMRDQRDEARRALDRAEATTQRYRRALESTLSHLKRHHRDPACPVVRDAEEVLAGHDPYWDPDEDVTDAGGAGPGRASTKEA